MYSITPLLLISSSLVSIQDRNSNLAKLSGCRFLCALKDGGLGKGGQFFQFYLACGVHVVLRVLVEGGWWARGVTTPEGRQTTRQRAFSLCPLPEVFSFNLPGPSPAL